MKDNEVILAAMEQELASLDHKIWTATSAAASLAAVRRVPALEVVVLDLGLPDMPGFDVLHRLRTLTKVPLIAVGLQTDQDGLLAAQRDGADGFIMKPFSMPHLASRITRVLARPPAPDPMCPIIVGELHIQPATRGTRRTGTSPTPR